MKKISDQDSVIHNLIKIRKSWFLDGKMKVWNTEIRLIKSCDFTVRWKLENDYPCEESTNFKILIAYFWTKYKAVNYGNCIFSGIDWSTDFSMTCCAPAVADCHTHKIAHGEVQLSFCSYHSQVFGSTRFPWFTNPSSTAEKLMKKNTTITTGWESLIQNSWDIKCCGF